MEVENKVCFDFLNEKPKEVTEWEKAPLISFSRSD